MSKKGSRMVDNSYVPMIGCFVAGFVVNRLMNHQDVVTGDVKEGNKQDIYVTIVNILSILYVLNFILIILCICKLKSWGFSSSSEFGKWWIFTAVVSGIIFVFAPPTLFRLVGQIKNPTLIQKIQKNGPLLPLLICGMWLLLDWLLHLN